MRMRNHSYRGKAISSQYSECVFLALVIECVVRMGHIAGCCLSVCATYLHLIS